MELKESIRKKLTRTQADIGNLDYFTTMENRLKSLAKCQANIIENKTFENTCHPYLNVIGLMTRCLDTQPVVDEVNEDPNSVRSEETV